MKLKDLESVITVENTLGLKIEDDNITIIEGYIQSLITIFGDYTVNEIRVNEDYGSLEIEIAMKGDN